MKGNFKCPACGAELDNFAVPISTARLACAQILGGTDEFHATGLEAMEIQERIIGNTNRMISLRAFAPYVASVSFAMIAAALIILVPDARTTAANIVAAALLVLATGIAGFTRFGATLPGMSIKADTPRRSN